MNICIYGAASPLIENKFKEEAFELGFCLGSRGHSLIYGGGNNGVMGAAARGFKKAGACVTGIAPGLFDADGILFGECDEMIRTKDMAERKLMMESMSDAFIACPGGVGTFDELFQVLTLKQLNVTDKPICIYNIESYYDDLISYLKKCCEKHFILGDFFDLCLISSDREEVAEYIENHKGGC